MIKLELQEESKPMESKLLEIEEITLLSIEEAHKLPKSIRACSKDWWLRTPGNYPGLSALVYSDGTVLDSGHWVDLKIVAARSALIILELEDLDLEKFKDSVEIFGIEWIYIGDEMVLVEEPIFSSVFNSIFNRNSNNYETSELKQKLENWLKNQMENY